MPARKNNVVRLAGQVEKFSTSRHSLGIYRSVINTCRYTVPNSALPQQQGALGALIESALAHVILRHDILRVGLEGEDTKHPAFVHVKQMAMQRMIEWKELTAPPPDPDAAAATAVEGGGGSSSSAADNTAWDEQLLASLKHFHVPLWDDLPNKPPWRIIVHYNPAEVAPRRAAGAAVLEVSFAFHHAYSDGKSSWIFHRDLLAALNNAADAAANASAKGSATRAPPYPPKPPEQLQDHVLYLPRAPTLPLPLEQLITLTWSFGWLLAVVFARVVRPRLPAFLARRLCRWGLLAPSAEPWTGTPVDAGTTEAPLHLVKVPEPQLRGLLPACRLHGTTLTGLLHGLVLLSMSRRTRAPGGGGGGAAAGDDKNSRNGSISSTSNSTSTTTTIGNEKGTFVKEEEASCFRCTTPIALTPFVDARHGFDADRTMHNLVTTHPTDFSADNVARLRLRSPVPVPGPAGPVGPEVSEEVEAAMWEAAAHASGDLRRRVAALPRDDLIRLLRYVLDFHAMFRRKLGRERECSWELSNIGSMDANDAGKCPRPRPQGGHQGGQNQWRIRGAVFSQGAVPAGAAFTVKVAGVRGDGVTVIVGWQEGAAPAPLMEGVVADLRRWLPAVAAGAPLAL
ncbi:hypothetical protein GGR56DRAFT_680935 [Xylariaceae sp. FL0804]|nr:hypothetical protein GGR56DRAFT_680935 [Xylariaceae sp. FL0804]